MIPSPIENPYPNMKVENFKAETMFSNKKTKRNYQNRLQNTTNFVKTAMLVSVSIKEHQEPWIKQGLNH